MARVRRPAGRVLFLDVCDARREDDRRLVTRFRLNDEVVLVLNDVIEGVPRTKTSNSRGRKKHFREHRGKN